MLRRLVITLGVLVGLLGLADRGLAIFAGDAVATAVQRSEGLQEKPDVKFRGFPFVTQAVRGRFERVDVTARDVRIDGLTVTRVEAALDGVEVSLAKALSGEVRAVPVSEGRATVTLGYADLNAYLTAKPGDPTVAHDNGRLLARTTVGIPNRGQVEVVGAATLTVAGSALRVRVTDVRTSTGGTVPTAALGEARRRLTFDVPLDRLPFGVTLESVRVTADGIVVAARAEGIVVRTR